MISLSRHSLPMLSALLLLVLPAAAQNAPPSMPSGGAGSMPAMPAQGGLQAGALRSRRET